ncbi:MAG: ATP-binding protein [Chloroflexota bacterium]
MIYPEIIKEGEGPRVAFLETADALRIAETLVAFANTEGGTIIIGLKADGTPSGEPTVTADMQTAMDAADGLYNPPVVVDKWEEIQFRVAEAEDSVASDANGSSSDAPIEDADEDDAPSEKTDDAETVAEETRSDEVKAEKSAETSDEDSIASDESSEESSESTEDEAVAEVAQSETVTEVPTADDTKEANTDIEEVADEGTAEDDTESTEAETVAESDSEDEGDASVDEQTITLYAVRVPRSIELHALSDGRVLIRSGQENRPLGGQEILRLASAKNTGAFEAEVVPGTTKDHFNREMIEEYLAKRAERSKRPYNGKIDDLLQEIGAITADGKPTMAGILLFTEYPQQWLPQSSVVFAKFVGTTPRGESGLAGYTRREELTGPLPRLIEAAWNLIWSEMAVSAVVKGLEREERTEYPQFAVREAIVNAICHRDYRLRGRRIELRMYSDRLEVISPGGLPGFITVDNIKDEHFSRNPHIVSGLFQWGYIEELGLGIDRMIEVMEQAGHQPPTFDARPYSFAVTLQNERQKPKQPDWVRNTNHRQAKALQYIRENGSITNREYRGLTDDVSAETLRLDLVDMVEKGILIKVGSKKGTYYILK